MTEAEILSSLNLGSSKAILNNTAGNPLSALLQELTQEVIDDLRKAMQDRKVDASRNLSQSIKPTKTLYNGKAVSVGITMDFYWKYVNYGVNGTEVSHGAPSWGKAPSSGVSFHDSIKNWISQKGAGLPEQFKTYESFAWAVQRNIVKNGKEPRPFFEDVINDQLINVLKKPIQKLLGKSIKLNIISPWQ
jgi:hypothetical protein